MHRKAKDFGSSKMAREIVKISIIIPTRNRPKSLASLLTSILRQTRPPEEVLVVDDSDTDETAKVILDRYFDFITKGITLKHVRGNRENRSITAAKNIGVAQSNGEIIFLIDDDAVLFENYVEEILKTYTEYPEAKGIQGYIVNQVLAFLNLGNFVLNATKKIFRLDHFEKNKCTLRGGQCYPYSPDGIINCEWLQGTNMSYKREVFASVKFDENLKKRSIGEDADFSYRVYKRYPYSLLMNPRAKLFHIHSPETVGRHASALRKIAYLVYLKAKNTHPTFGERILNLWFFVGLLVVDGGIHIIVLRDSHYPFSLIESCFTTMRHLNDAKMGDFRFIDSTH